MLSQANLKHYFMITALLCTVNGVIASESTCGCRYGKLDCSRKSLTSLLEVVSQPSTCGEVHTIDVSNNQLSTLDFPNGFLRRYANASLWVGNNHLTTLEGLQDWTGQGLNAENNQINNVNVSLLSGQLQQMRIDNNLLTSLDLSQANELKYLNARHNSLEEIVTPGGNCSLLFVDLSNNNLSSLPSGLTQCSWIMMLDASNNSIAEIPDTVLLLTKLRRSQGPREDDSPQLQVDLRGNPLDANRVISSIQSFQIREGNLRNIPENGCECTVLRTSGGLNAPVRYCISSMCGENDQNMWINL